METRIRQLGPSHLRDMLRLQSLVAPGLPRGFLRARGEDDLSGYLGGALGAAYGVFERGALVAWSLLRLPTPAFPLAGTPFPHVPLEDQPLRLAFLENALVHPDWRGNGYQRAMYVARHEHAERAGMRWLASGVHVANTPSWTTLLSAGLRIVGIRFDPGYPILGLLEGLGGRRLMTEAHDGLLVELDDAVQHKAALDAGRVGARRLGAKNVRYERLLEASDACGGLGAGSDRLQNPSSRRYRASFT